MDAVADIFYWVKLALLVVVVVLALVGAVRGSGTRSFVAWRAVAQMIFAIAGYVAIVWFAEPGIGVVWAVVLILLGGAAGFFVARRATVTRRAGRVYVRRSPLAPWVWAIGSILVALTLLFGSSYLFALAMLVLVFALGLTLGQLSGEWAAAGKKGAEAPPVGIAG